MIIDLNEFEFCYYKCFCDVINEMYIITNNSMYNNALFFPIFSFRVFL